MDKAVMSDRKIVTTGVLPVVLLPQQQLQHCSHGLLRHQVPLLQAARQHHRRAVRVLERWWEIVMVS